MRIAQIGVIAGSAAVVPSGYHYGYPAYGAFEPNVVCQWLLQEAAGNIVDEVSGYSLTKQGAEAVTYQDAWIGAHSGVSPGIAFPAFSDIAYFEYVADITALNWTCNDGMVLEAWVAPNNGRTDLYPGIFCLGKAPAESAPFIYLYSYQGTPGNITCFLKTNDGSSIFFSANVPVGWHALNTPQKIRVVIDPAGAIEIFLNGLSIGSASAAVIAGDTLNCKGLRVGDGYPSGNSPSIWRGSIHEVRVSFNKTNNSGG